MARAGFGSPRPGRELEEKSYGIRDYGGWQAFDEATPPARLPTVLIADDDPFIRQLIASTLRAECEILHASNGIQALDLTRSERPDLVILDYVMPGLDGLEVCRRIKKQERALAETKVIILTAFAPDDEASVVAAVGADAFLRKPFGPRQLLEIVTSMVIP